jgi:hypothetical protein
MKASVLEYMSDLSPESRARVTKHFSKEVEEFSVLVAKTVDTLQRYHSQNPMHDDGNPKEVAFGLMTKGANTLMAGFELVLTGYMWEPGILFRSALEGFAVAWDLVHTEERFAAWKTRKAFRSTDSISNLKKAIEPVGKMYGLLSNMHVHTNPDSSSPSMFLDDGVRTFQFFGLLRPGKEHLRKTEVCFGIFSAYVCLQLTELVFHSYSAALETIERIPGTDSVRTVVSARHRPFVEAAIEQFRLMANDPLASLQ